MSTRQFPGVTHAVRLQMASVLPRGETVDALIRYAVSNLKYASLEGTPLKTYASADVLQSFNLAAAQWAPELLAGLQDEDAITAVLQQTDKHHWVRACLGMNPVAHRMGLWGHCREALLDSTGQLHEDPELVEKLVPTLLTQNPLPEVAADLKPSLKDVDVTALSCIWRWEHRPPGVAALLTEEQVADWQAETWATGTGLVRTAEDVATAVQFHAQPLPVFISDGWGFEDDWLEEVLLEPGSMNWRVLIGQVQEGVGAAKHVSGQVLGRNLLCRAGHYSGTWLTAVDLLAHWNQPLCDWLDLMEELNKP